MDYKDQQIEIYRAILQESSVVICRKVQQSVIRSCQKMEAEIFGDTGLKSLWEEICIIVDEGEGDEYESCLDTLDEFIREALDQIKLLDWQKSSLWLMTSEGIDWTFGSERMVENYCTWCQADVVRMIRDDYLVPTAMNWTNSRIRRYSEIRYEMG
ncbi:MAG: hypothetical protein Q7U78_07435 [Gallionella sp.]|nr:hypothetical protein [Gallionella sp.]